jgi:hypothetical protein
MRHLAVKFVDLKKLGPPLATNIIHVVDPLLSLHDRFRDLNTLQRNCQLRGIDVDVREIEKNYLHWWDAFKRYSVVKEDEVLFCLIKIHFQFSMCLETNKDL